MWWRPWWMPVSWLGGCWGGGHLPPESKKSGGANVFVQARSTLDLHSDVACRVFHTGCKVQVSIIVVISLAISLPKSSPSSLSNSQPPSMIIMATIIASIILTIKIKITIASNHGHRQTQCCLRRFSG